MGRKDLCKTTARNCPSFPMLLFLMQNSEAKTNPKKFFINFLWRYVTFYLVFTHITHILIQMNEQICNHV